MSAMVASYYATTGAKAGTLKARATAFLARSNKFALVGVLVGNEGKLSDMHMKDNRIHLSNPVIP